MAQQAGARHPAAQKVARHNGPRERTQEAQESNEEQGSERLDEGALSRRGRTGRRLFRSTVQHIDTRGKRSTEGHAQQTARAWSEKGKGSRSKIIACSKCGAHFWERASALGEACPLAPVRRSAQLRKKIRASVFPHRDFAQWTISEFQEAFLVVTELF